MEKDQSHKVYHYGVQTADSVIKIAYMFNVSIAKLKKQNQLHDRIFPGQTLDIYLTDADYKYLPLEYKEKLTLKADIDDLCLPIGSKPRACSMVPEDSN